MPTALPSCVTGRLPSADSAPRSFIWMTAVARYWTATSWPPAVQAMFSSRPNIPCIRAGSQGYRGGLWSVSLGSLSCSSPGPESISGCESVASPQPTFAGSHHLPVPEAHWLASFRHVPHSPFGKYSRDPVTQRLLLRGQCFQQIQLPQSVSQRLV